MSWTMQNEAEGLNLDGSASFQASLLQYFFFLFFLFFFTDTNSDTSATACCNISVV